MENIIEKILDKKVIKYLDIQVKKEKDENIPIKYENKKDKKDFNYHIKLFNYILFIIQVAHFLII